MVPHASLSGFLNQTKCVMPKRPTPKAASSAYVKIQKRYGLQKPSAIKMRIIWLHVQALIRDRFPGRETDRNLARYDRDFRAVEREQMRKGA
jgi:hypothetical protein